VKKNRSRLAALLSAAILLSAALVPLTMPFEVRAAPQEEIEVDVSVTEIDPGVAIDNRRFLEIFIQDAAVVENAWIEAQFRWQKGSGYRPDEWRLGTVMAFSPIDKLEFGGSLDWRNLDVPGGSESGFGDTTLYGKWQFFRNPIQFAVGLEFDVPTGDKDKLLGTGEWNPAIFGSVRKNLAEAYLTGYFGFRFNGDANVGGDLPGPSRNLDGKTSILLGGGAMFPVTDRFGVSGELTVETERYEQSDSAVDLIGGAYWWVSHKFTLRGGLGFGLADASPDWQFIASGVWHF